MTVNLKDLQDRVLAAIQAGESLQIRGGGSKDWYGETTQPHSRVTRLLDVSGYEGVVDYEPSELVLTVRSGTRLADIETLLAEQRQMLAFELPCFTALSTIGGAVAAGLSGPRRASAGAVRDFVLGAQLLDGQGRLLNFGGQVMKNVAGYDVSRLLAGSLGVLGVMTQVSLKLSPVPAAECTLQFEMDESTAITRLNRWATQGLPISASVWWQDSLMIRLSGSAALLPAICAQLGGQLVEIQQAQDLWKSIRDQTHPFFAGETSLWRFSVASHAAPLGVIGSQFIEWGGALRWVRGDHSASVLRGLAEQSKGHVTLYRYPPEHFTSSRFTPLSPALLALHQRLKAQLDPHHVFNPGRLHFQM